MWEHSIDDWQNEIKKSLKRQEPPEFFKNLFLDHKISPFSHSPVHEGFQRIDNKSSFLTIQNYSDLKRGGLDEWLDLEDVGYRFRQLEDVVQMSFKDKSLFFSQPFPFLPEEALLEKIRDFYKNKVQLNLGWSPLSFGLTRGEILKKPFKGWEKIFVNQDLQLENVDWFYLSSAPYQWAGADPHMELAILLSLASSVMQELNSFGISGEMASRKITFGLSLGTDILVESSKIAALKLLWTRLNELYLDKSVDETKIYVLPSLRYFSGRDPWNNVLRTTMMAFSAYLGGASGFKCIPYDVLNKNKSKDALRVSTNIPLLLKRESFMDKVLNPLDGAGLFDATTSKICEAAWTFFQEIEKKGGLFESVRSGWIQNEIKRNAEYARNQLSYFQKEYIGVNKYIAKDVSYGDGAVSSIVRLSDIIDPLFLTKSPDDYLTVEPLIVSSLSYEWELLQIRSDQYKAQHGKWPHVTIVKGAGPVVGKKMNWLMNLLNIGCVEASIISADEIDAHVKKVESRLAILVPSQDEMEESLVAVLRPQTQCKIWSMNHEKENAKIDKFILMTENSLELIKEIHAFVAEGL